MNKSNQSPRLKKAIRYGEALKPLKEGALELAAVVDEIHEIVAMIVSGDLPEGETEDSLIDKALKKKGRLTQAGRKTDTDYMIKHY